MTKFLLENVYGPSRHNDTPKKLKDQSGTDKDYIPSMYMIRRLDERDDISFGFYRYTKPNKAYEKNNHQSCRGLIEIDLIETSSTKSDMQQLETIRDRNQQAPPSDGSTGQLIGASLSYQEIVIDSKKQSGPELIPGGFLHSNADGTMIQISDQMFVDRLASPAKFTVALDGGRAAKLWSLFEDGDVRLELSINWQLQGIEYGKPIQQMITQTIPVLTSMTAQRNCFHKYEVWADLQHDFTDLNVQCFCFLMGNPEGLQKVMVIAGFDADGEKVPHKTVRFDQHAAISSRAITFPALKDEVDQRFFIKVEYHFVDGEIKEAAWKTSALRYFDASLSGKLMQAPVFV